MQNFRPLGSFFLAEVEFVVGVGDGGGVNSNNRVKPNQVEVKLSCGKVGVLTICSLSHITLTPSFPCHVIISCISFPSLLHNQSV